ncbi:hypothetical protein KP509_28G062600 [Ceratopteris richardii]|nr:hypothetical protein KP509_28G062600 [Ceratopteris richardii]
MHWRNMELKTWNATHCVRAHVRRTLTMQLLAMIGINSCPALVRECVVRANELVDVGNFAEGQLVLQGLPFTFNLMRADSAASQHLDDDELEEILSIKLKFLRRKASAFRVFVNMPDANIQTPVTCNEFAGLYFHEPRRVNGPDTEIQETTVRLGIGDIIKELGLSDQSNVLITLVPFGADRMYPIVIEKIRMELE